MTNLNLDKAVNYHYQKFPPSNLNYGKFLDALLKATDAVARYDQMLKNMHNSEILLAPLRNQEAVISSRMEGTVSTMDEILKYEADHADEIEANPNVRSEVIETILYQRALKSAQNMVKEGYPLSPFLVKTMHERLLRFSGGVLKSPGQFKSEQNYIADTLKRNILFIPISPEKLQDGMDDLFRYIGQDIHPTLVKVAITHVEFEALHPFKDGNGRVGRMLITLMLWVSGSISEPHFYISSYLEDNKDLYIDAMRNVSETNDWESWCGFFLEAVEQQAIRNLGIAESIRQLYEEMKSVFSDILSSKYSLSALDFVFTNPVFKNSRFTASGFIPSPTAARFTRVLLDNKLLALLQEASGRRSAIYSFEPLMRLIRV